MAQHQPGGPVRITIGPYKFDSIKAAARHFGLDDTALSRYRKEGRAEHHVIRALLKRHWYKPERYANDLQVVAEIVQHMARRAA